MTASKATQERQAQERTEARETLRALLKPGDTVYTILRHCSASGMSRSISLLCVGKDGDMRQLDYLAARLMGDRIDDKREGIKVSGCGMDMGFQLVYNLGRYLWPDGTEKPHGTRNGQPDSDGGYALKQRWL